MPSSSSSSSQSSTSKFIELLDQDEAGRTYSSNDVRLEDTLAASQHVTSSRSRSSTSSSRSTSTSTLSINTKGSDKSSSSSSSRGKSTTLPTMKRLMRLSFVGAGR
ncbi:hypothetical protein AJ80_09356 [Polytolypa hystricis UAMH7299]|uniref:Uncharacterized protein n=1 Tax=Polytolypa hystricis (strain UAMH7299) TaxID=1447883 RepID=A0A2B7WS46_POLH7|nr:hypothetical protein AJ80_09356 [Polytolypa hystricis UAMH7299]